MCCFPSDTQCLPLSLGPNFCPTEGPSDLSAWGLGLRPDCQRQEGPMGGWPTTACGKPGLLSSCSGQASYCGGFFHCRARALGYPGSVAVYTDFVAPLHVESSKTRDQTHVAYIGRHFLIHCITRGVPVGICNLGSFFKAFIFLFTYLFGHASWHVGS